jgi:hypothetical protein
VEWAVHCHQSELGYHIEVYHLGWHRRPNIFLSSRLLRQVGILNSQSKGWAVWPSNPCPDDRVGRWTMYQGLHSVSQLGGLSIQSQDQYTLHVNIGHCYTVPDCRHCHTWSNTIMARICKLIIR